MHINVWENLWNQHVYGTLELWKGTKIYSVGKRIPTVYYSLTEEIGTYAVCGLALEKKLKFMPTSVLAGAKNKQVIKIDIYQTKNSFIIPKQISSTKSSKF